MCPALPGLLVAGLQELVGAGRVGQTYNREGATCLECGGCRVLGSGAKRGSRTGVVSWTLGWAEAFGKGAAQWFPGELALEAQWAGM